MTSSELHKFVQQHTHFITDLEEIIDIILESQHIYVYDTSAISSHEKAFYRHGDLLFHEQVKNTPILITDVIAKEMRLIEDIEGRYMSYLSQFRTILYVQEQSLLDLLKVEYDNQNAKQNFLIACEKAFSCIQPLRDSVRKARGSFSIAENIIFDDYESFFAHHHYKNHGEMSLVWTTCIINQIRGKQTITFMGIDQDLFLYVEQCYFTGKNKANNIYIMSNEALLQSNYIQHQSTENLTKCVDIYRNADRRVTYHERNSGILQLTRQCGKFTNDDFINKVCSNEIQIIY